MNTTTAGLRMTVAHTMRARGSLGSFRRLALGALLACVAACSGGVAGVGAGGDAGGDGGGERGDGGPIPDACTTTATNLRRACVPGTAKANTEIRIEVDGDGCFGCGTTLLPCKVDVAGSAIRITLEQRTCPLPEGTACPAVCGVPSATCAIPPLAAGDYTIELTTDVRASDDPVRRLVVTAGATATACEIPDDQKPPPPIFASDYPRSCVGDEDCFLVTEGSVCQVCACATAAISKTSRESYEADVRARQSLCTSGGGAPSCAPCEAKKARCDNAGQCIAASL